MKTREEIGHGQAKQCPISRPGIAKVEKR